jgi:4-hydroxybenzoyl-CoA reductase subunit alpha
LAQKFKAHADGGAYNSTAPTMIALSCFFLMIPYHVPNLIYEGAHIYTNKPVGGAMRGHGIPQARFAVERQLDMIADRIGVDPVELRMKNSIHAGEPHSAGFVINTCGFSESVQKAADAIGWAEKRGKLPLGRGVGLAGASFPSGVSNMSHISSGAVVQLGRDGAVNVLSGAADIGQGAETVISQIVAEELGVRLEDIRITAADTGITPLDPGTFGSGVTVRAGNAARLAAISAKQKLFSFIADKLEAYQYADLPMPIVGRGSWMAPASEPTTLFKEDGNFAPNYSFMTQAAEVEVDLNTGKVKLLRMVTAHDCGRPINPMLVEGQLEGSVVGGMGQALYEDVIVEKGQVMNPSFLDYGFPTFMEMPEIEAIEVETDDPIGPFGAKEAGEGTQLSPAPAIVNAIYDAIGVDFLELPVTPEKILDALEAKQDKVV